MRSVCARLLVTYRRGRGRRGGGRLPRVRGMRNVPPPPSQQAGQLRGPKRPPLVRRGGRLRRPQRLPRGPRQKLAHAGGPGVAPGPPWRLPRVPPRGRDAVRAHL
eukprot:3752321-Pyramimonas_sp.AAC.1